MGSDKRTSAKRCSSSGLNLFLLVEILPYLALRLAAVLGGSWGIWAALSEI